MARLHPWVLLPGLIASWLLLADYTQESPVFCTDAAAGCTALRGSSLASIAGVPTPLLGVLGLSLLLLLGVLRGAMARKLHAAAGALGAALALLMLGTQVVLGTYCSFCLVVDLSALSAGVLAMARVAPGWDPAPAGRARWLSSGLVTGATALAALYSMNAERAVAPYVLEAQAKLPPGKFLVLDFVDFECPYCRLLHADLEPLLEQYREQVQIERRHIPLRSHPHAKPAALAALCAERLSEATHDPSHDGPVRADEQMVNALFSLDPQKLTRHEFVQLAQKWGYDGDAFNRCLDDDSLEQRLAEDRKAWQAVGAEGLPTLYVGSQRFVGVTEIATLRAAFAEAASRAQRHPAAR